MIEEIDDVNNRTKLAAELLKYKPEATKIKERDEKNFWERVQKFTEMTPDVKS